MMFCLFLSTMLSTNFSPANSIVKLIWRAYLSPSSSLGCKWVYTQQPFWSRKYLMIFCSTRYATCRWFRVVGRNSESQRPRKTGGTFMTGDIVWMKNLRYLRNSVASRAKKTFQVKTNQKPGVEIGELALPTIYKWTAKYSFGMTDLNKNIKTMCTLLYETCSTCLIRDIIKTE